jgi:hypothetical protein
VQAVARARAGAVWVSVCLGCTDRTGKGTLLLYGLPGTSTVRLGGRGCLMAMCSRLLCLKLVHRIV